LAQNGKNGPKWQKWQKWPKMAKMAQNGKNIQKWRFAKLLLIGKGILVGKLNI
jgi:hypothetical protein